jgi:cell wall assembly regulator SMI1
MADIDWDSFLRQWSRQIIDTGKYNHSLPPDVIASGWLGFPGATEEQLQEAESRLGVQLPPSYRQFLATTNGWRMTGTFIYRLWSTEEVDWFRTRNQDWIDAYTEAGADPVPDSQYFVYGPEQDPIWMRPEYLPTMLEVSDTGQEAIYLLNPNIVTPEGEWEAWFFGNWLPGADRYRSFWDMMQAEYATFRRLNRP